MRKKRVLFIPVSSPCGVGEYVRSLVLAQYLDKTYENQLAIHFILNKHTEYAQTCPYKVSLLASSATLATQEVCALIERIRPHLVVFDCAGRAEQMKTAKLMGAKVVFISQHVKKRAKGLKLNRIKLIDNHWVVQPDYCIKPLSWLEKFKLKCFDLAYPHNVGSVTLYPTAQQKQQVLAKYALANGDFFIVNAGSGGHRMGGVNCADVFYRAALVIAKTTQLHAVVVFGPNYTATLPSSTPEVTVLSHLDNTEFLALLAVAKAALLSAGDTLLQALNLKLPCVAAAVSKDQPARLAMCVKTGLVHHAQLAYEHLAQQTIALLEDAAYHQARHNLKRTPSTQSEIAILNGMGRLLELVG